MMSLQLSRCRSLVGNLFCSTPRPNRNSRTYSLNFSTLSGSLVDEGDPLTDYNNFQIYYLDKSLQSLDRNDLVY